MKAVGLLIFLVMGPVWAAGVGSSSPCTVSLGQEGAADDVFVDTSGAQPQIFLSLQGVARQVDPTVAAEDLARLKREREACSAAMPATVPLKIRVPQNSARPLGRWVLADFNGDGRKDSAYVSSTGVAMQMGLAGRGFEPPPPPIFTLIAFTYDSAGAGDVNGDGKQDLLVCCSSRGPDGKLLVMLGNGDGTFGGPVASVPATAFALTDWNGDGKLDVIALTPAGTLTVSLGQGNGTFQLQRTEPVPFGQSLAIADATGDGRGDVIVLDPRHFTVYPGSSDGSFGLRYTTDLFWNQAQTFSAADFTGDGKLDLAVTHQFGMTELWKGDPPVGFVRTALLPNPHLARTLAVDLDDAGAAELLLVGAGLSGMQIVPVNSVGVPQGSSLYALPGNASVYPTYAPERSAAAVADFDRDGRQDVAVVMGGVAETVLQVFNASGAATPLSITLNNVTNVSVIQLVATDVNGDGWADLLALETESQSLLTFRNNGSGQLTAPVVTALGAVPRHLLLADFSNDSRVDMAIATGSTLPGAGRIQVRYNLGGGNFGNVQSVNTGVTPFRLATADFNGDFKLDLAYLPIAPNGGTPAGVVLNRVDNLFQTPVALPLKPYAGLGVNLSQGAIQTADLNFDGAMDLLIGAPYNDGGGLAVFLGDGKANFRALALDANVAANVADLTVLDIDNDSNVDVLVAHCCGATVTSLYYGRGDGTFGRPHLRPTGSHTDRVWLADVTGDGQPELVARTYSGVTVTPLWIDKPLVVSSAASGRGPVLAVDSIASAYGANFTFEAQSVTAANPYDILGVRMSVVDAQGKVATLPLFYASPGQVNFMLPAGLAAGPARVTLQASAKNVVTFADITLARVAPGLFIVDPTRLVAANVIRVKSNGQQIAELPYAVDPGLRAAPIDLGPQGEIVVLVLYATGVRGRNGLSDVTVTIGGVNAPVAYAGAQNEFPGLDQVNVTIPRSLVGRGSVEVVVTVEGQASNAGRIEIR